MNFIYNWKCCTSSILHSTLLETTILANFTSANPPPPLGEILVTKKFTYIIVLTKRPCRRENTLEQWSRKEGREEYYSETKQWNWNNFGFWFQSQFIFIRKRWRDLVSLLIIFHIELELRSQTPKYKISTPEYINYLPLWIIALYSRATCIIF